MNNDEDQDVGPLVVSKGDASTSAVTVNSRNTMLCDSRDNVSKSNVNNGGSNASQPTIL